MDLDLLLVKYLLGLIAFILKACGNFLSHMEKNKLGLDSALLHWFAHGFVLDWQNMGGVVVGLGFRA